MFEFFFFRKSVEKLEFHENVLRIKGILHKDVFTFMAIPRLILLRIKNISSEPYREHQITHFMPKNLFAKIVPFVR
jgi:hypothetical protein